MSTCEHEPIHFECDCGCVQRPRTCEMIPESSYEGFRDWLAHWNAVCIRWRENSCERGALLEHELCMEQQEES